MGIARKKVTYDKGEETRNPNPDRGPTSLHKPAGSSLAGSKAASRANHLEMQEERQTERVLI